jgi:hypothetical protein
VLGTTSSEALGPRVKMDAGQQGQQRVWDGREGGGEDGGMEGSGEQASEGRRNRSRSRSRSGSGRRPLCRRALGAAYL